MLDTSKKGTLRLYACGGGGINIARFYNNAPDEFGYANIAVTLADTSTSNYEASDSAESRFQFQATKDGSGKERAVNADAIAKDIPRLLSEHPPGDLNVVLHTASGGTGSVAGYLTARELLSRGLNTVVVLIGTSESGKAAMNTWKTFKSYDGLTSALGKDVVISYIPHTAQSVRSDVDQSAREVISCLSMLGSRQNREFDTMDLTNFLQFSRNTLKVPSLGLLRLYFDPTEVERCERNILTMASLYTSPDSTKPNVFAPDSWDGYFRENVVDATNFHLVITTSGLDGILTTLQELGEQVNKITQQTLQGARFTTGGDDKVGTDGVVL